MAEVGWTLYILTVWDVSVKSTYYDGYSENVLLMGQLRHATWPAQSAWHTLGIRCVAGHWLDGRFACAAIRVTMDAHSLAIRPTRQQFAIETDFGLEFKRIWPNFEKKIGSMGISYVLM